MRTIVGVCITTHRDDTANRLDRLTTNGSPSDLSHDAQGNLSAKEDRRYVFDQGN